MAVIAGGALLNFGSFRAESTHRFPLQTRFHEGGDFRAGNYGYSNRSGDVVCCAGLSLVRTRTSLAGGAQRSLSRTRRRERFWSAAGYVGIDASAIRSGI